MYSETPQFAEKIIKNELHTLSETIEKEKMWEKIKEKIQGNTLDISENPSKEVKDMLHFLLKNKTEHKALTLIVIPETFFYEDDSNVKLLLDVFDSREKLTIKTDKWNTIPRPPKSL